jgi:hypothetical protein
MASGGNEPVSDSGGGGNSDQVPEYGNIKISGHEGGDFVFPRAGAEQAEPAAA